MNMAERIRIMLVKRNNMSESELARRVGTSPQNLHNKFKRNNFSTNELEAIAAALDCDLLIDFIDKETKEAL